MEEYFILSYVYMMNCHLHLFDLRLPPLAPYIFFSSSHSCSSSSSYPFTFFIVLQCYHEEGNLGYVQSNWLLYVGYCLEASSSLFYVQQV
jgi:hypothetical protein